MNLPQSLSDKQTLTKHKCERLHHCCFSRFCVRVWFFVVQNRRSQCAKRLIVTSRASFLSLFFLSLTQRQNTPEQETDLSSFDYFVFSHTHSSFFLIFVYLWERVCWDEIFNRDFRVVLFLERKRVDGNCFNPIARLFCLFCLSRFSFNLCVISNSRASHSRH